MEQSNRIYTHSKPLYRRPKGFSPHSSPFENNHIHIWILKISKILFLGPSYIWIYKVFLQFPLKFIYGFQKFWKFCNKDYHIYAYIWQDSSDPPLDLPKIFRSLSLFFEWSFWLKSLIFRYVFAKQEKIGNRFNFVFLVDGTPTKLFETSLELTFLHDFQKVYQWHFALNDFFIFQWNFTVYLAPQHFVKENR